MTHIQEILQKHPDAATWQQQYPWFSIANLLSASEKSGKPEFEVAAQRAAIFLGNVPRLHWLLHQPMVDKEQLLLLLHPKQEQPEPILNTAALSEAFEHQPQFALDLSGPPDDEENMEAEIQEKETAFPKSSFSSSLAEAAGNFKKKAVADDAVLFEAAYQHTVDYFASQGIQLDGEPDADDRFGLQLKTFTSWLRQMKRLPNALEQDADATVETHAAHSLQKDDVVTESMVDVLLKQGKKQHALLILEKLRLLHPEKSLYFAARTEQIKHS